ncbi:MAG: LVIVD repeat-containing protein [Brevinematia bacterium]
MRGVVLIILYANIVKSLSIPEVASGIFVSGNYAYLANDNNGLKIVDISDPANASIVKTVDTPGNAKGVYVSGKYAYVADGFSLQVIDINEPTNACIIKSVDIPGSAYGVYINGRYVYVAAYSGGIIILGE